MKILNWRDASRSKPTAVALGNFDGVHLGHRRILEALRARAERDGLQPLALTFEPHPRQFLSPDAKTSLLTPPAEKEARIAEAGVDVLTLAFDADLASLSAEDFVSQVLRDRLKGEAFFLGPDHRFGKGARGNCDLLRGLIGNGADGSDRVLEIPPVSLDGELVSSSAIRQHLENGDAERANALLGYAYRLRGEVVRGDQRGRLLGFPTANLRMEDARKILPFGVFGGYAYGGGERRPAVGNIGLRPTFAGKPPSVEVHLLDWDGDLYGQVLEFEIVKHIRPEQRFDSLDALKAQINADADAWRKALRG